MHVAGLNTEQAENAMCFYIMQTQSCEERNAASPQPK